MAIRSRQKDLVNEDILHTPIHIIGAGGIGSFTALSLAKCGFDNITVWDFDNVEEHNLPNQFYPISAIGNPKVSALGEAVSNWCDISIKQVYAPFSKSDASTLSGVVISAVDNMEVRADIYEAVRRNKNVIALIDGRMGGNQLEIYTTIIAKISDKKNYVKHLYKDNETANIPCTQRAVIYNVLNIASWIVNQTRLVLSGKDYNRNIIFDLENMILLTPK